MFIHDRSILSTFVSIINTAITGMWSEICLFCSCSNVVSRLDVKVFRRLFSVINLDLLFDTNLQLQWQIMFILMTLAGLEMSIWTQTQIANEALLPVTERNTQKGILNHYILNSDLDWNSPTAVWRGAGSERVAVALPSDSPADMLSHGPWPARPSPRKSVPWHIFL